ncbi:MAG: hypothetical protein MUF15_26245 [Acidobacteria bacterium]|jgi:hypothetical protein|nr:hypothetical protein [Acidobacteriota bacterium]
MTADKDKQCLSEIFTVKYWCYIAVLTISLDNIPLLLSIDVDIFYNEEDARRWDTKGGITIWKHGVDL